MTEAGVEREEEDLFDGKWTAFGAVEFSATLILP